MANLTPVLSFDDVFQIETTTPVTGGPGGVANSQAQSLANRTEFIIAHNTLATVADLRALAVPALPSGRTITVEVLGRDAANDGGNGRFYWQYNSNQTDDNALVIRPNSLPATGRWLRVIYNNTYNVKWFNAKGDGTTDDYTAIEACLVKVRATSGKAYFPVSTGAYLHSATLQFGASNVVIEGESTAVRLRYTGTGTGLAVNSSYLSSQRERCSLRTISLYSTTGAIAFDWTGGNYGNHKDFEIEYTAADAVLLYAQGSNGAGPYYNQFSGFSLFGSVGRTQTGIWMDSDSSGNLADGPNANVFSDLKRCANLSRMLNIVAGGGNLFVNMGGESISDALIVLNDISAYAETGTATSATTNTLVDSSQSWSAVVGDSDNWTNCAVILTSGAYAGQSRKIVSNTSTTLTLDKSWPSDIGTPAYAICRSKAVSNKFINIRQEGITSSNPDGVRIMPGALHNEFSNIEIGSIGSGLLFDDQYGETSNKFRLGEFVLERFVVTNPGASASVDLVPRNSVYGGIRAGSQMSLEFVEIASPNFTTGEAVLTVDHGGSATGNGSETLAVELNSFNTREAFIPSADKTVRSTANNGIFVNLATDGSVGASADFIVTVAYRVV